MDSPKEVEHSEHQDWPDEQRGSLRLCLVVLYTELVERRRQTTDSEVCQKGEGTDGAKAEVLLRWTPSQRICDLMVSLVSE